MGGNDHIEAGQGVNLVMGGFGNDSITQGATWSSNIGTVSGKSVLRAFLTSASKLAASPFTSKALAAAPAIPASSFIGGDSVNLTFDSVGNPLTFETTASGIGNNDHITITSGGYNYVIGGTGADTISVSDGTNSVLGDEGRMTFTNGHLLLAETLNSGIGSNDFITTGDGINYVIAGVGDDIVHSGAGFNVIFGDEARFILFDDTTHSKIRSAVSLNPEIQGFDVIETGRGHNTVVGGSGSDWIYTDIGESVIFGDNAQVVWTGIHVRDATTIFHTIGGNDHIHAQGGDSLIFGGFDADTIRDGNGDSFIAGDNGNATLSNGNVRTLITTDRVTGSGDAIYGGSGNDHIFGGKGDDFIDGGSGNDVLLGDHGSYHRGSGSPGDVTLIDEKVGGHDTILGSGDNDLIYGQGGDDHLDGGDGEDSIFGSWGEDYLYGGKGDDVLVGGPGADFLDGGPGADTLYVDIFDTWVADYADTIIGGEFWSTGLAYNWLNGGFNSAMTLPGGALADLLDAFARLRQLSPDTSGDDSVTATLDRLANYQSKILPVTAQQALAQHYDLVRWGGQGYGYLVLALPRLLGLAL
jgi:Ca2+-binding RTX toxin-like protein